MADLSTALSLLSIAFTAWAGVVAWGVKVIRAEVVGIKVASENTSASLHLHVNQTERRLTLLETEWSWIKQGLHTTKRVE